MTTEINDLGTYLVVFFISYVGTCVFLYEIKPCLKTIWYWWHGWANEWDHIKERKYNK